MTQGIFTNAPSEYQRDIDIVDGYVTDAAFYLHKQTGRPLDQCTSFVRDKIQPGNGFNVRDPEVLVLSKETPGNRTPVVMTFTKYLQDISDQNLIISPTLAAYYPQSTKRSLLSDYIAGNIAERGRVKGEMFEAKMNGQKQLAEFKNIEQSTKKIKNNSLSGGHASTSTILFNKSSHSTLTSTCRAATSYGNANNEKFIAGNRHYWSPDIVLGNIVSIITHVDHEAVKEAIRTYDLVIPSAEDVMDCIEYSARLYWREDSQVARVRRFVEKLNGTERAAFVYVSDLYHLAKHNPDLVRGFLGRLSKKADPGRLEGDPDAIIDSMDDDMKAFVSLLCAKELDGGSIAKCKETNPTGYATIAATAEGVVGTLSDYALLIRALWVTDNMPPSISSIPSIVRRTAITSDTDSTIFTVQYWTEWYRGQVDFTEESLSVAYAVVYLASQLIIHVLAKMSANMGIEEEHIHRLAMKNEFYYPIFSLTNRRKHYFAYVSAQEGNVYDEYELEIKGVALKNSNCPPHVMKELRSIITDTMDTVIESGSVSLYEILGRVAKLEQEIKDSINGGRYDYMTTTQIKTLDSYADPDSSNYIYYDMWETVFAPKYGHTTPPTYSCVKVSVDADNPTKLRAWLENIEDRSIADRLQAWLTERGKVALTQLLLPEEIVAANGIPREAIVGVDVRKLIFQTMSAFYLFLESVGVYMVNDHITRLVSDFYDPQDFLTNCSPLTA